MTKGIAMELREIIEAGIRAKGSVNALADYLGIARQHVSNAKAHQRGLPNDACMKLAKLLEIPLETVIGASELATERKEDKRAFWLPFVTNAQISTQAERFAQNMKNVTNFVTETPAKAAPLLDSGAERLCIM
jgi:plasmid maintenance system antidote protein VapI